MALALRAGMRAAVAMLSLCVSAGPLLVPRIAAACGCFAPPDPTVPVVQAGERILFSRRDGIVTAHIQIQYAGAAREFGWLLPLPSLPELQLGTDELFTQLIRTTQPSYRLQRVLDRCVSVNATPDAGVLDARPAADAAAGGSPGGVVVEESSIGPYDYAILRADSRDEMLGWLADNRYFVPVGTADVVAPYIRRGAYFLALKLRPGKSAGDLQPVVVRYPSDLPMIPIILTSVAAQPDMGIQVWMLGDGRAVPRNYAHTVLNDAALDWVNGASNYNNLVIRATREAPGRHTFVTEYSGTSSIMRGVLDRPGRFGDVAILAGKTTVRDFIIYLNVNGYSYTTQLISILAASIPVPAGLAARGLTPAAFYFNITYWLDFWMPSHPEDFVGWSPSLPGSDELAAEINERIVAPTLAAGALFTDFPYLTRLYTTLSPEQMNRDPVFSENRDLPLVSNIHQGTLTLHCGGKPLAFNTPATLVTEQGWVIQYPSGTSGGGVPSLPGSRRIEALNEEGPPGVIVDNDPQIIRVLGGAPILPDAGVVATRDAGSRPPVDMAMGGGEAGCACSTAHPSGKPSPLLVGALLLLGAARFRSWRRSRK